MAIFHLSVKVISRAVGRSAVAAAAYRSADRLHDQRLDRAHDFSNKSGVVHSEVLLPDNAPDEWHDRERLWNDVEAFEKRKDAQLAREVEFAIPREMNQAQGIELAQDFVQAEYVDRGMIADLNVHWDIGADGIAKPHAHVMLTMREIVVGDDGEAGFGAKVREWNRTELVEQWRERWADHVNQRLAELDIDARIDHRSLEAQGIALEPQYKIGPAASSMGDRGLEVERIEDHRAVAQRNGERIIAEPRVALDAITHHQATFTNRDLAIFAHRHSDGREQFDAVMGAVRASPDLIELGQDGRGEDRFTSRDMIETEQRLQRAAEIMAERERHRVSDADREGALARAEATGLVLSGEQRGAFEHVTSERDLSVVVGYAGTGKSAMLGVAREAWKSAGLEVRGAALSGIAAEGLENGSGIASRTIASLEHGWSQGRDLLTSRDVLVIDEAGMVGTRQIERVLGHAADAGAKVVLVGDPQQLQAIEAGAAFRSIHERNGGVEITEVRRQRENWQQDSTRELATGRTGDAIRAYDERGMVHAAETREAAREELIEHWDRDRKMDNSASRIILTHTNDEVRELNDAGRGRMRAAGDLGDDVRLKVERGDRDFASGDRIIFLRNERSLDVKNGTLGTIEQVNEQRMAVRTDDGRSVAFDIKDYRDLDHGYAATIHKAQGMTVDKTHVLATPGMDRHGTYVAMSRHRDGLALHYGRDDFRHQSRLVRTLSRERPKDMASDYARADPTRTFAERRGIGLGERVAKIVKAVPEKVRGIFDNFRPKAEPERGRGMFDGFRPAPRSHQPERSDQLAREVQPMRAGGLRGAVERYARAVDAVHQTRAQGFDPMPHQRVALDRAKDALDAIRPHASADLGAAFERQPELVREAAEGRSQTALQAMSKEAEIRIDPYSRADRFVEGWQQLQRQRENLVRDGDLRGAKRVTQTMSGMAKSLERDAQLESVLGGRSRELGLEIARDMGRSLSRDLANSIPVDHVRDLGRGMGIGH
ncbi:conjugal transfer protein TraA [Sphingopyxis sp. H038]|uniref:Ti-type conjugative transfer relaxase TraA n=1 Tax=unclassified Sphingopyxis TaxID=2614943 RepID=UPI00072FEE36|nr:MULTISPECIES: Ti-type conjugative transfer relaxase TraA [unclassified Sphingopyxis]KTD99953.1 conjugal transfer protein TraA [Sphingopyxis sp. H012]KTE07138.1 conjugal transfer protein TraA [Sphingopyxis sp. H053]KTE09036.1 conjugal transfer protein TraA [Sphingopyxis sp. H093]KTE25313.1 conjugal transfer protein TraA [Sphingopyxis sp. H080]KTE36336.1 conjugal transfer protein TraA [Sphingopyxis sp. H038]